MKHIYGIVVLGLLLVLSSCVVPGYNASTADLVLRAEADPNYIEAFKEEYEFTMIYLENDFYFDDLVFVEPTDIYDDVPDNHIGFHVIMGNTMSEEEIILYIPQYEEFPIYVTEFPFLAPNIVFHQLEEYNQNHRTQIDFQAVEEDYMYYFFNHIGNLNEPTKDVLENEPILDMMIDVASYQSSDIGSCTVYLVKTGDSEFVLIANADYSESSDLDGYIILDTITLD